MAKRIKTSSLQASIIVLLITLGCGDTSSDPVLDPPEGSGEVDPPVCTAGAVCRSHELGVSGPGIESDIVQFFRDVKTSAHFYSIHMSYGGVNDYLNALYATSPATQVALVTNTRDVAGGEIEAYKAVITQALSRIAQAPVHKTPKYWCFGNERQSVAGDEWVFQKNLANELSAHVKAIDPSITTCMTFQFEAASSGVVDMQAHLSGLDMDLLAFTSYPQILGLLTIDAIGEDYYSEIASWTSKPIGFTEYAWPSQDKQVEAGGQTHTIPGSEAEQVRWLLRSETLVPRNTQFLSWFMLNDLPVGSFSQTPFFEVGGLRNPDGTAKAIMNEWLRLLAIPVE